MAMLADDLGQNLELLDTFLMSDQLPDEALMLSELDGFLTGLALGPELIMPSEWLPIVWGGDEPVFNDLTEAQTVMQALMSRYNEILRRVEVEELDPVFLQGPDGETIAGDWAEGFLLAVHLREEAWGKLAASDTDGHLMLPILALCCTDDGEPLVELPKAIEEELFANIGEILPTCVLKIAAFWKGDRVQPQRRSAAKAGRNDLCPCGSGRKFKKCCAN